MSRLEHFYPLLLPLLPLLRWYERRLIRRILRLEADVQRDSERAREQRSVE